jgi:hypothetical protein
MEEYHVTSLKLLNKQPHAVATLLVHTIIPVNINQGGNNPAMV